MQQPQPCGPVHPDPRVPWYPAPGSFSFGEEELKLRVRRLEQDVKLWHDKAATAQQSCEEYKRLADLWLSVAVELAGGESALYSFLEPRAGQGASSSTPEGGAPRSSNGGSISTEHVVNEENPALALQRDEASGPSPAPASVDMEDDSPAVPSPFQEEDVVMDGQGPLPASVDEGPTLREVVEAFLAGRPKNNRVISFRQRLRWCELYPDPEGYLQMETHRFRVCKDVARWMKGWNKMQELTRSFRFHNLQSSTIKEFPVAEEMHNCITQLTEEKTQLSEHLAELILKTSLTECSEKEVAAKPSPMPRKTRRGGSTICRRALGNLPVADIEDVPSLKHQSSSRMGLAAVKVATDLVDVPVRQPCCEVGFSLIHKTSVVLRDSTGLPSVGQGMRRTTAALPVRYPATDEVGVQSWVVAARTAVRSACSLALRRSWL